MIWLLESFPEDGAKWCHWKDSSWYQLISNFAWTPRCWLKWNHPFMDLLSKILQTFTMSLYMCYLGDDLKKPCLRFRERSSFLWSYTNSIMWTSSRGGELMFPLICSWQQRSNLQKRVKLQNRFFSAKCSYISCNLQGTEGCHWAFIVVKEDQCTLLSL